MSNTQTQPINLTEARYHAAKSAARIDDLMEQVNGSSRLMFEALQYIERNGGYDDAVRMQTAYCDALFSVRVALRTLEGQAQSSDELVNTMAEREA